MAQEARPPGELATSVVASRGDCCVMVQGAAQRSQQLQSKIFGHGGHRPTSTIAGMMPRGGAGLKQKVPKRKEFGPEGEDGDAAHQAAMREFSLKEFGEC